MSTGNSKRSYHVCWCVGGFLFPVCLVAIALVFQRSNPNIAANAWPSPNVLEIVIGGTWVGHAILAFVALCRWPTKLGVWLATIIQFGLSLFAGAMSGMAVTGEWL